MWNIHKWTEIALSTIKLTLREKWESSSLEQRIEYWTRQRVVSPTTKSIVHINSSTNNQQAVAEIWAEQTSIYTATIFLKMRFTK